MPAGTLYVVATPIGNLEDITLRALRVLREADIIAAEDTRHTARLLTRHAIHTPTISFHAHNSHKRIPGLVETLAAGQSIALVTDAGTPGIADPGTELVRACVAREIRVEPIPGPSAPLTAAVASGFPLCPLSFFGFAPHRSNDRKRWLSVISRHSWTLVFFETPHRIRQTLNEMGVIFGNRPIMVARELTKAHQEFTRGSAGELAAKPAIEKGEFTIVVGPAPALDDARPVVADSAMLEEFWLLTKQGGVTRRQAISLLARRLGRPQREVYDSVQSQLNLVKQQNDQDSELE